VKSILHVVYHPRESSRASPDGSVLALGALLDELNGSKYAMADSQFRINVLSFVHRSLLWLPAYYPKNLVKLALSAIAAELRGASAEAEVPVRLRDLGLMIRDLRHRGDLLALVFGNKCGEPSTPAGATPISASKIRGKAEQLMLQLPSGLPPDEATALRSRLKPMVCALYLRCENPEPSFASLGSIVSELADAKFGAMGKSIRLKILALMTALTGALPGDAVERALGMLAEEMRMDKATSIAASDERLTLKTFLIGLGQPDLMLGAHFFLGEVQSYNSK
jgi:hypothetical protein